jgi:sugar phosphate isomerase/epimerase
MSALIERRGLLAGSLGMAAASGAGGGTRASAVQLALNAYSFNTPLRDGAMTLEDVVDYCAQHGIRALDATGYYFPGYPAVPSDETIYRLKRRAFRNGMTVHGTGVRNDFAVPDSASRKRDVQLVKDWIDVAQKVGASVIRVFSGRQTPPGYTFEQVLEWIAADLKECVSYGERRGVMIGLQNHHDFLKTAEETIRVVKAVNSDWFGVVLDVGSLRQSDPYEEIERLVPHAISWQLKESVWYGKKEVPTDVRKVKAIIDRAGYRGMLPIETLGAGDPRVKVAAFLAQVRAAFGIPG